MALVAGQVPQWRVCTNPSVTWTPGVLEGRRSKASKTAAALRRSAGAITGGIELAKRLAVGKLLKIASINGSFWLVPSVGA
jgi:hypothetical protein